MRTNADFNGPCPMWANRVIEFNQFMCLCVQEMKRIRIHIPHLFYSDQIDWDFIYALWLAATEINSLYLKSTKKHVCNTPTHHSYLPFLPCHSFCRHLCFSIFQFHHSIFLGIRKIAWKPACVLVWDSSLYVMWIVRPNTYNLYVQYTLESSFLLRFH